MWNIISLLEPKLVVASAGDLPITGADLNLSCITVRGTAVPHPIRLCPDVAVITELSPGAGLAVGVGGGVLPPSLTHHSQGPVWLPGVCPVPAREMEGFHFDSQVSLAILGF